jgi:hypothetical protein
MTPIPEHLAKLAWYAPHQAWLKAQGRLCRHDPGDANLTGANLTRANLTDADLTRAYLTDADLTRADLTDADLTDADLAGADLTDANLTGAYLAGAYLTDADLTRADLADARNAPAATEPRGQPTDEQRRERDAARAARYRERNPTVPVVPQLDSQILALVDSGKGTLDMGTWHRCETTHCRAGWAITLAGEAGRDLEKKYGPAVAGGKIYRASTGRIPHFYAQNDAALADIRACAAREVTP